MSEPNSRAKSSRSIQLKRAYERPARRDGFRILVDRLWPRGVSKSAARIDLWLKEIAPSDRLRKWFGHDPAKWPEFRARYLHELERNREAVGTLVGRAREATVTLVYAAKDDEHNNAVVVADFVRSLLGIGKPFAG